MIGIDMPNKSDSAGKIHEYYTYLEFKNYYQVDGYSPFDSEKELPTFLFTDNEIQNLKQIGILTFNLIKDRLDGKMPKYILHAGEKSGGSTHDNTDDLIITLNDDAKISFSLKCAKDKGTVLSKNMGAKSLISTYFGSDKGQNIFNDFFEIQHLVFLNSIFDTDFGSSTEAKKYIKLRASNDGHTKDRFEYYKDSENHRNNFLIQLPNKLKEVVSDLPLKTKVDAANLILDAGKNIIFATYGSKVDAWYHHFPKLEKEDFIKTEIRDNRSMTLVFKQFIIGFRYKFESSITSSIKLVGDYTEVQK